MSESHPLTLPIRRQGAAQSRNDMPLPLLEAPPLHSVGRNGTNHGKPELNLSGKVLAKTDYPKAAPYQIIVTRHPYLPSTGIPLDFPVSISETSLELPVKYDYEFCS